MFSSNISVLIFFLCVGGFSNDPLSEFIVFEIPTFLLFSALIASIYAWKVVAFRKSFFPSEANKYFAFLGLAFVWSLWIIVTVVYAEVILGESYLS